MAAPVLLDQGNTYRCGAFGVRAWFEGYGYDVRRTNAWEKYIALADGQKGLAFSQVRDFVAELSHELGMAVTWRGDGYLRKFDDMDQAIRDGQCVIVGVQERDIHPGQNYYHYIDLDGESGDKYEVVDSFHFYDADPGEDTKAAVRQAILDSWDPIIVGLAFSIPLKVAPPPTDWSREAAIVTMLSVIGENTYPDGSNLDTQAEGQPEGVTKRVFIRQLVQQGKALFGAR